MFISYIFKIEYQRPARWQYTLHDAPHTPQPISLLEDKSLSLFTDELYKLASSSKLAQTLRTTLICFVNAQMCF